MKAASYTRGVDHAGSRHYMHPEKENTIHLDGMENSNRSLSSELQNVHSARIQNNSEKHTNHLPSDSLLLGQYKRHAASMSAAPIRGSQFKTLDDTYTRHFQSEIELSGSPKKQKCYSTSEARTNYFYTLLRRMKHSKHWNQKFIKHNKIELVGWVFLTVLVIIGYKFFSDGSFSAVLTLASAFQCFSLALLCLKVYNQKSIAGVSQRSLCLIIICLVFRLGSTLFYNGYLPVDRSGDWVYQLADILAAILAITLLLYSRKHCVSSIQSQTDKDTCSILIPLIVVACLALWIHPNLNQNIMADVAWTFALYVETFAMVPQLFMMGKLGGEVEALTSHFIASMATSKILTFLFWYFSYTELGPRKGGLNIAVYTYYSYPQLYVGWAVILSYSVQALLFVDFM